MSFGLVGLLGVALFIFIIFFLFKQIQFFFTAVDLYKGMNQRLDKIIELLSANVAVTSGFGAPAQGPAHGTEPAKISVLDGNVLAAPTGPLGTCPNCSAVVALAAEDCPKCKASFGIGSAWKVQPR